MISCSQYTVDLDTHDIGTEVQSFDDHLATVAEQVNSFDELRGDGSRLIMMHDNDRWAHLPVVKEIDGFRIVKAS